MVRITIQVEATQREAARHLLDQAHSAIDRGAQSGRCRHDGDGYEFSAGDPAEAEEVPVGTDAGAMVYLVCQDRDTAGEYAISEMDFNVGVSCCRCGERAPIPGSVAPCAVCGKMVVHPPTAAHVPFCREHAEGAGYGA